MKGPYTQRSARAAAFYVVLLRVPAQIATLVGYIILVRLLSETEFGIYSLFYATIPVVGTLVSFGLENTLRRYQPEYLRRHENRVAHRLVGQIGQFRLASNIALLLVIFAVWPYVAPFFKIADYPQHFALFALLILTHFQCEVLRIALSSHLLQKFSVGVTAAFSLIKLAGYVAGNALFGFDLWIAICVDLAAYCLFLAALKYFYVFHPDHKTGELSELPSDEKKRLIKYGAFYSFNDAGTLALNTRVDGFYIAAIMDPIAVGAYAFCNRLNEMIERATPARLLESIIQPMFVSLNYKENPEKIHSYFSFLLSLTLLAKIPIFAFIVCYHRELVLALFDGRFLEYSHLLIPVFLFSIANALAKPVTFVAQLKEKAHLMLASKIFGIYNIAANLLLIPVYGVSGAIFASGSASVFKNLFIWWFVRDLAHWNHGVPFMLRSAAIWTGYIVFATIVGNSITAQPAALLAIGIVLWGLFFLLYLRSGALAAEHKALIEKMFSGKEQRWLRVLGVV